MKPQIPWLRVFVEGVVIVGSILLALGLDEWRDGVQDRAYNHHAFHEDAEPRDLGLQLGTRRFSSSKKCVTTTSLRGSSASGSLIMMNRSPSAVTSNSR